ncbi:hypothetical protein L2E82_01977 [Cichorium intybus]|uniref:Uncharacterized protein n=1 Tax=Cichorium intybus TaxID=13427 RepID=A0ACB9H0F4_CICIN|nr:hypothetical protein L2E82_01977 [Cichorium intybus]
MDPYIEEILITAAQVTFYEFNVDLNQWVCFLLFHFLFAIAITDYVPNLNNNLENLVENLLGDFEFELQIPYLLYRNAAQEVNGNWFYNSRECEDVANLFTRILGAYSKFEELEAVPTSATAMNLGHNPSNPVNYIPPYPTPIPLPSRDTPSPIPNNPPLQNPSSVPTIPLHDNSDQVNTANHVTNLIKPLSFFTPTSSSAPPPLMRQPSSTLPVTTLQPPLNVQRNIGIPLLQPFPPPTPPSSLTPTSNSAPFHGPLTRGKVRDALVMVSQGLQMGIALPQFLLSIDGRRKCNNCNLYAGAWQPSLNISTILTSIGLLLSEPNPDDGLMCEASKEYKYNKQVFDQKARFMTKKYAKFDALESNTRESGTWVNEVKETVPCLSGKNLQLDSQKGNLLEVQKDSIDRSCFTNPKRKKLGLTAKKSSLGFLSLPQNKENNNNGKIGSCGSNMSKIPQDDECYKALACITQQIGFSGSSS